MIPGKVYLVGAGPGDPELLTVKALKIIQAAGCIVYDRLVSEAVMALTPPGAERFFVGKSCRKKTLPQEEIHELLIALAEKGRSVVRLKGGDPLLFGRGGEEALALARRGIPFEIVPGITSAQGCGAYAGIPLTHRGLATGVRFITGHREAGIGRNSHSIPNPQSLIPELNLDWPALADPDTTLVVYMGLANLGVIAQKLIEHGLPTDFPAAAIAHGTTPRQRVILSDLAHIAAAVAEQRLESPLLAIIGKVAALSHELQWLDKIKENSTDAPETFTKMSH